MSYVAILREVHVRLQHHAKGMLQGLHIRKAGEWRVDGEMDLPQITLVDLTASDSRGTSTGVISMFLTSSREDGWFKDTDAGRNGLYDWIELVMDAMETMPSDGKADQMLIAHNPDGTLKRDAHERPRELLAQPFKWEARMAEIRDMSYTAQLDISYQIASTGRGRRRHTPFERQPLTE
jgi:hypothetical protein